MIDKKWTMLALAASLAIVFDASAQSAPQTDIASRITNAQALVDRTVARHPELVELEVHAQPMAAAQSTIIAAKAAERVGKKSDRDDIEVVKTGVTRVEINEEGDHNVEVEIPLYNTHRQVVGSVEMTFPFVQGFDRGALILKAERIRDEISNGITDTASLMQPASGDLAALKGRGDVKVEADYNKPELGNQQSLPMTKAVVSGKELENASQEGYSEAVKNVAGVAPANSRGSSNDSIYIRGIKLNLFSNYRLNGGLPTAGVQTTPNEDKTRVEALKGANALMFGVASPAGIINLVTKRAESRDITNVGFNGNAFGQYGFSADIARRLGDDKQLGIRVNVSETHLENGVHGLGGRGDFESLGADYKFNDRLSAQLDIEHYTRRVPEQAGISIPTVVNGHVATPTVPDPRNLLSGTWAVYTPRTTNIDGRLDYVISPNWRILGEAGKSDAERQRYTTRISGYSLVDGSNGTATINYIQQRYRNTFNRVEVLGTFDTWVFSHRLTIGIAQSERNSATLTQNTATLPQRQNIYDPIVLQAPVFRTPFTTLPLQISKDVGVYTYDTITVLPQVKVLAGIRRTQDREINGPRVESTQTKTPAYGLLYDILPTTTLFGSVMQGLEVGATAPVSAINAQQILSPAISKQKEIGIRDSHFDGLSINASYFQITRANPVTNPVTRIFANSGVLDYKGAETTVVYDVTKRFSINMNAQWLTAIQNSPGDATANGFVPENTAKWIGNLTFGYRPAFLAGLNVTAGVSAIARRFINNQDQGTIPGYLLFNMGAGYNTTIAGKRLSLQLSVDNVGNLRYWNSVQTGTFGTGMDRTFRFNTRIDL